MPQVNGETPETRAQVEVIVLDVVVIVQLLSPLSSKTFHEYIADRFVPYVKQHLEAVRRLDIVFDVYKTDSFKAATRERRGVGTRRKVSPDTQIPAKFFARRQKQRGAFRYYCAASLGYPRRR